MQDLTRECSQLLAAGAYRDVRRWGLPFLFVSKVETAVSQSWLLAIWLTPTLNLTFAFQVVND